MASGVVNTSLRVGSSRASGVDVQIGVERVGRVELAQQLISLHPRQPASGSGGQPVVMAVAPARQHAKDYRYRDGDHGGAHPRGERRFDVFEVFAQFGGHRTGDVLDHRFAGLGVVDEAQPQPCPVGDSLIGQRPVGAQRAAVESRDEQNRSPTIVGEIDEHRPRGVGDGGGWAH
jgi:hypothetical protein